MSGVPQTRVYLPLTADGLELLRAEKELAAPLAAYALVAAPTRVRDREELEYAAWLAAAAAAQELVGADRRRVVASADVDAASIAPLSQEYAAEISSPVLLRQVASFHLDEEPGGDDADLLWYDVTEIDEVARLAAG